MIQNKIDLKKRFKEEICSFEIAKKVKHAAPELKTLVLIYDDTGEISDGGWLKDIRPDLIFYPAIDFIFAMMLLEETTIDGGFASIKCHEYSGNYFIQYRDEMFQSTNLVDVILELWLKYKK